MEIDEVNPTESPKRTPKKAKKEAKKEVKEARKEEKQKVKEEKQKQKQEEQKQKQEEKEAKKERDMKKKIHRKIRKKLATPYGDVSGVQSVKDLSAIVLADYEVEATAYKQIESFFNDTYSKISKNNQKILAVLEERRAIIKDITENGSFPKEKHAPINDALQRLTNVMQFHSNLMVEYYSSFQLPDEENPVKTEPTNDTKNLRKEYYKLLDRYEQIETKIHSTTKEKAVTAVAMHKITEAEQTRELIKSRLKQLGHVMLVQQQDTTSALINNSMQFICETMKQAHHTYNDGLVHASQQLMWVNEAEEKLIKAKEELEINQAALDARVVEMGTEKWFDQIIKKKAQKDQDISLAKSPVLHIAISEGALEMMRTVLDNNPEYLDMQDRKGWTPLHVACHKGYFEIAKELLLRGASVDEMTENGETALHFACSRAHVEIVELLLNYYEDNEIDNPNRESYTPLQLSVKSGSIDIFKMLIDRNCDADKPGPEGSAIEMAKNCEKYEYLSAIEKHQTSLEVRRAKFRANAHRESVISIRTKGMESPTTEPRNPRVTIDNVADSLIATVEQRDTKKAIEEWNSNTPIASGPSTPIGTPTSIRKARPTTPLPLPPSSPSHSPTESKHKHKKRKTQSKGYSKPLLNPHDIKASSDTLVTSSPAEQTSKSPLRTTTLPKQKPMEEPLQTRLRARSKSLTNIPAQLKPIIQNSSERTQSKDIGDQLLAGDIANTINRKIAPRITYSNNAFEFTVQKRNSKTYQYNRRKILIFQDKLTIYVRNKLHKEFNTKNLLQCSRSIKYPRKIKLLWRFGKKVEKYLFTSTEQRERFYEAVWVSQHGLNHHPYMNDSHELKIFVGTWNMGNAPPPNGPDAWLQKKMDYDMYVIGLQESDYPEAKDNNTSVESHLLRWFSSYLGKQYVKLVGLSLWEIRMFILVKREHYQAITNVKTGSLACGVAGVMANKGAVGASFRFHETTMAFICSHLAAHQNKTEDRNEHFRAIVRGLSPSIRQINNSNVDITNQVDHLFWIGDLNYRIDLPREEVMDLIKEKNWNVLLKRDQLRREIDMGKAFMGFNEEIIVFKPSYKYAIGSTEDYAEDKPVRVPAWCDRVLFRSLPISDLKHESYGCCDEITTSDHHPVFATFKMTTRLANLPSELIDGFRIVLANLSIKELRFAYNDGAPSPYVTFIAPFLENSQKTPTRDKTRNPEWEGNTVELVPIITNRDYLICQTLRVVVGDRAKIVQEKHKAQRCAQTLISLKDLNKQPTRFEVPLTSCGYGDCGVLSGEIFIQFQAVEESPARED